jgi:hypothetical protein
MTKKQRKNERCKVKHIAEKVLFDIYSKIDLKEPDNFDSSLKTKTKNYMLSVQLGFYHFHQATYVFTKGAGLTSVGSNIYIQLFRTL